MLLEKEIISATSIVLMLVGFYPYIRGTLLGAIRPHVFSWVIWAMTTLVVSFAQLADGAGVGAWPILLSGVVAVLIAVLAWFKRRSVSITRSDYVFFGLAMLSLPIWYITSDPLWAVVLLTGIDLMAFVPTGRKIMRDPESESVPFYALLVARNLLAVWALEHYSLTTVLFPLALSAAAMVMIGLILRYRKRPVWQG